MSKKYFIELANYNVWATGVFCNMLQQISEEQWLQKIISSFNSIQETALHVVSAENAWTKRMQKKENIEWLQVSFKGTESELIELWKNTSAELKDFIIGFDEADLETNLHFKRFNGEAYTKPFHQIFSHVFNHATYHRGQLVTMLRQVGFTGIQPTDLIEFYK
jgi:uncharacterized damage-inducible protein DinB